MDVFKTKFLPEDGKILVQEGDEERWLPQRRLDGRTIMMYQGCWIPLEQLGLQVKNEQFVSSPIARPPPKGYHSRVNFSKKSIAWLKWIRHSARIEGRDLNIRHALTGRGTRYSIDGYVDRISKTQGVWHTNFTGVGIKDAQSAIRTRPTFSSPTRVRRRRNCWPLRVTKNVSCDSWD